MYIGLEKENLIFDTDFNPHSFNIDTLPEHMTLDYSDNQIEFVSGIHETSTSLVKEMYDLLDNDLFLDKYIWPLSNPGINDYTPSFTGFSDNPDIEYREYLKSKYDKNLLNMSGIHFNFSFKEETSAEFYFEFLKKIYVFGPILQQFVAYTPVFQAAMHDEGLVDQNSNRGYNNSISLRNSQKHGYYNEHLLNLDYSSYATFDASISSNIDDGTIKSAKEIYSKVRLKNLNNKYYLELRFIDINPFNRLGISLDTIDIIMTFLNYLKDVELKDFSIDTCLENFDLVALNGYDKSIELNINNQVDSLYNHTLNLLKNLCSCKGAKTCVIASLTQDYIDKTTDLDKFMQLVNNDTILEIGKKLAHKKEVYVHDSSLEHLELSTKILIEEARRQNRMVNIIDAEANAIEIDNKHIIFQATKTNVDNYANVLVMENKLLTKYVLNKHLINTPLGISVIKGETFNYNDFFNKKIVVKPVDTNFGLGISIFDYEKEKLTKALDFAFSYSDRVIIEEFFTGTEFRFLVIDDEVVSIVKRIAANVVGDGIHNIKELVDIKNCNPLRGNKYTKPLEFIKLGDFELDFLKQQGLNPNYIPKINEVVYLRENSNVSTGGDSAEVLDLIPLKFKIVAQNAAIALGVKICGIDMIIDDNFTTYTIIEANFNPAIQMHTYPLTGVGKNIAHKILRLLDKD